MLYYVILLSAIQQSASAIHRHTSLPFWISFPGKSPRSAEWSSLCCIQLVLIGCLCYTEQCISASIPASQIVPHLPSHSGVLTVLCVYVSLSVLQISSSAYFSRVHIAAKLYEIFFLFLTYFTLYHSL